MHNQSKKASPKEKHALNKYSKNNFKNKNKPNHSNKRANHATPLRFKLLPNKQQTKQKQSKTNMQSLKQK